MTVTVTVSGPEAEATATSANIEAWLKAEGGAQVARTSPSSFNVWWPKESPKAAGGED